MGCGSSTLKGDKVESVAPEPAQQPVKRVRTNFSDVDFAGGKDHRRPTLAVAPDEQTRRPTKIGEIVDEEDPASTKTPYAAGTSDGIVVDTTQHTHENDDTNATPYKPIAGERDGLASPTQELPHIEVPEDAHTKQKSSLASEPTLTSSSLSTATEIRSDSQQSTGEQGRRKSWLARIKEHSRDKSMDITDEELKKQTGMTRAEFEAYKKNPANKVGGHARAEDGVTGRIGFDSSGT